MAVTMAEPMAEPIAVTMAETMAVTMAEPMAVTMAEPTADDAMAVVQALVNAYKNIQRLWGGGPLLRASI